MKSILSVEDDPLQAEWIGNTILKNFPELTLRQMSTEYEFVSHFEDIASNPPNVILLDAMLRWTDPAPQMPSRPADVKEGGVMQAWLRCQQRLNSDARTRSVPVVLYTVLQRNGFSGIPGSVLHIQKDANPVELIKAIKQRLLVERPH